MALCSGVEVNVGVSEGIGVKEAVGVAVSTGVRDVGVGELTEVDVGVGDPAGVVDVGVSDTTGVGVCEAVAVGKLPITVTVAPVDEICVRTLFPVETRTVQSIED